MQWYEIIIMVIAILLVIVPIASFIIKKHRKTLKCECGHLMSECTGKCDSCLNGVVKNKDIKHKYILHITGMKCGMCEAHINDLIRRSFDVSYVKSYLKSDSTVITSNSELDCELLKNTITLAGYTVDNIKKVV